jgi:hypothetical protein
MGDSLHIKRASRRLEIVFRIVFILIPVINALVWLFINGLPDEMQKNIMPHYVRLPLPAQARLMGFLVSMLSCGVAMYGTWAVVRLMRLYEAGRIFSEANVRCFRDISRALIIWCGVRFVSDPLMSIVLTLHHPKGQRLLVLGINSMDVTALLVGFVLGVIAWVMEEGRKLREEADLTV